jgi:hypothetical protein
MVRDELGAVVSALCVRFPDRSRSDVEHVVADVYARLVASAKFTAHLIPLTLNRSRRLLDSTPIKMDVPSPEGATLVTVGATAHTDASAI